MENEQTQSEPIKDATLVVKMVAGEVTAKLMVGGQVQEVPAMVFLGPAGVMTSPHTFAELRGQVGAISASLPRLTDALADALIAALKPAEQD